MDFDTFEARAHEMWEEIPAAFREGIDGVVVREEAEAHPQYPGLHTMGMCFTEPYPSGYAGPDTTRSYLALYWGSFREIAAQDEDFDWEGELWETITHELRHHLEALADDDTLGGVDHAVEEGFKRSEGEPFDPWYWQSGILLAPGVYEVESDLYLESRWREEAFQQVETLEFEWGGARWSIPRPEELGDLHWVWIHGVPLEGGTLQLVLVRERTFLERLRVRFGFGGAQAQAPQLLESEAEARRVGPASGSPPFPSNAR
jgi:hypothetical protein